MRKDLCQYLDRSLAEAFSQPFNVKFTFRLLGEMNDTLLDLLTTPLEEVYCHKFHLKRNYCFMEWRRGW